MFAIDVNPTLWPPLIAAGSALVGALIGSGTGVLLSFLNNRNQRKSANKAIRRAIIESAALEYYRGFEGIMETSAASLSARARHGTPEYSQALEILHSHEQTGLERLKSLSLAGVRIGLLGIDITPLNTHTACLTAALNLAGEGAVDPEKHTAAEVETYYGSLGPPLAEAMKMFTKWHNAEME